MEIFEFGFKEKDKKIKLYSCLSESKDLCLAILKICLHNGNTKALVGEVLAMESSFSNISLKTGIQTVIGIFVFISDPFLSSLNHNRQLQNELDS